MWQHNKTDIAGKMYTDDKFINETTDFEQATFGDIAYWATKGMFRLPRYTEIIDLTQKGKWQFGYVTVDENKQIYGYLVTEPGEGDIAMTIRFPKELTKDDISTGLFLPCAGSRYDDTKAVKYAGYGGYYTSSILFEDSKTTHAVLALTMMAYTIVTERTVVMEVQFAL